MVTTYDFKETIRASAQPDTDFRQALLREAVESIINVISRAAKLCCGIS